MAKRKCMTCGSSYSYCASCYKDRLKPSWYSNFCSEECHELDTILSRNTFKLITDIEAKHKIERLDLSKINFKNELVRKRIDELLSVNEETTKKTVNKENNDSDIENNNDETKTEDIIDGNEKWSDNLIVKDINTSDTKKIPDNRTVSRNYSKKKRSNNNR